MLHVFFINFYNIPSGYILSLQFISEKKKTELETLRICAQSSTQESGETGIPPTTDWSHLIARYVS